MSVLLVNVDGRFNLALRRLWACYEAEGTEVENVDLGYPGYPHHRTATMLGQTYDRAWVSTLFDINRGRVHVIGCPADYGGMGSEHPEKRIPE